MTKLVGIVGSLRKGSINRKVLEALSALVSSGASLKDRGATLEEASLAEIPLYNGDLEEPASVLALKEQIAGAQGVILLTPEYNYGIPGVLKNALDWVSRPAYKSVMMKKPVAILGAAPGAVGTARAQGQLKQVLAGMASDLFPYPEVLLGSYGTKSDADGKLTDQNTLEHLEKFLAGYLSYVDAASRPSV